LAVVKHLVAACVLPQRHRLHINFSFDVGIAFLFRSIVTSRSILLNVGYVKNHVSRCVEKTKREKERKKEKKNKKKYRHPIPKTSPIRHVKRLLPNPLQLLARPVWNPGIMYGLEEL